MLRPPTLTPRKQQLYECDPETLTEETKFASKTVSSGRLNSEVARVKIAPPSLLAPLSINTADLEMLVKQTLVGGRENTNNK